jgi:hypothetical protein
MKRIRRPACSHLPSTTKESASSRPLLLAIVGFALGAVLAGAWFQHQKAAAQTTSLPAAARDSLAHLGSPVNIQFYSLLPADNTSEELNAFSARVVQVLDAVQAAGHGKIQVMSITGAAETNVTAATADGIQPFNMGKNDACFLGLSISSGAQKQIMPRLQPEWEAALPYDLARAILTVANAATPPLRPDVAQPSTEIISSIHRLIPDVKTVSLEQADQIFHAEFLDEYHRATAAMDDQLKAAQQKIVTAEKNNSDVELADARKELVQLERSQAEKIKQIAADLQTRLAVFQQMKAAADSAK